MLYVKSILLGFAGVIVTALLVVFAAIAYMILGSRNLPDGAAIGWDPVSWMRQSLLPWLILAGGFSIGFLLGLRWFKPTGKNLPFLPNFLHNIGLHLSACL